MTSLIFAYILTIKYNMMIKDNMMVHACAKFVVCRMSQSNLIKLGVPLYYGAPKSPARVGLNEGSEFFSLRYIGNK